MRKYTLRDGDTDRTYTGFQPAFSSVEMFPEFIAVVVFDGEPELWAIDWKDNAPLPEAIKSLKDFYKDLYDRMVHVKTFRSFKSY